MGVTVPTKPGFVVQPEATSTPVVPGGHAAAVGRGGVEEGSEGTGRRSERASVVRGRAYPDIRTRVIMGEHGTSVRSFRAVADIVFVRPRVRAAARSSRARVHWVREGGTFGELH